MPSTLSSLILDVLDIDRSLAFYHGLLRLPIRQQEEWDGHRVAYLSTGKSELLLVQQPDSARPGLQRSGLVIHFHVNNVLAIATSLRAHNIPVLEPTDPLLANKETYLVTDPDGYAVMISERQVTLH